MADIDPRDDVYWATRDRSTTNYAMYACTRNRLATLGYQFTYGGTKGHGFWIKDQVKADDGETGNPHFWSIPECERVFGLALLKLLAELKMATVTTTPTPGESWAERSARITQVGMTHAVLPETYNYYLEVLPPRWVGRGVFAFGEGADEVRLFWRAARGLKEECFCRQLTESEHARFCAAAGIPAGGY